MSVNPYTGMSVAPGVLELHLSHSPLAFLNALFTPTVRINGSPQARPWGVSYFELPAGQYDVRASFTYLFYEACPGALSVPIYPSYRTIVRYEAPFLRFLAATMRVVNVLPR
jgi:hypothetical protein